MTTGFTFNQGTYTGDVEDVLVRRDLFNDGNLWAWGYNFYGELGTNNITNYSSPTTTVANGTNWKQSSCGFYHTAAIKTDGTLWTWGYNGYGQLGNNTSDNTSSPVTTVAGGTNWKQVACGGDYTAAIKTDGTLWTWGDNNFGQLGDSSMFKSSPGTTAGGGTNWKQISAGFFNTAAIKTDGTLWTWGRNLYGEIGDNTTSIRSSPVTTIAGGTNWKQVYSGTYFTAAIKTDGTLWTWGWNVYGGIGDDTTSNRSSPVTTSGGGTNWKQVSGGQYFTAAIKTDGTLWTWGSNLYGKLGDGTSTSRSSPVTTVAGGTNWKQVSGGQNFTAAIKTDGTLWTWGLNGVGQLGNNTTSDRSSPVTTIAGGTNWKQVSTGYQHAIAITDLTL